MPLVNAFANNAPTDLADYYRRGLEQAQQSVTQAATQAPAQAQMPLADVIARLAALGITDLSQLVGKSDAELMQLATGAVQQQPPARPGVGAQALGQQAVNDPTASYSRPVNMSAPGLTPEMQAAIDKVGSYGGNISTVGQLYQGNQPYAGPQPSTNLSLKDWYKYQIAKVQAALNGQIVGESADFLNYPGRTAQTYLAETLNGGNISMYGPNAGVEQKALDDAARQQALQELGLTAMPTAQAAPTVATPAQTAPAKTAAPVPSVAQPLAPVVTQPTPAPTTAPAYNPYSTFGGFGYRPPTK